MRRAWRFVFAKVGNDSSRGRGWVGVSRSCEVEAADKPSTGLSLRPRNPRMVICRSSFVDSESAVQPKHSVWEHLRTRDNWARPQKADDDQAFLMVQFMETWLLADREALQDYFGARFRKNELKEWPQLEAVPKAAALSALDRATAQCSKRYGKGRVSFELLAKIDAGRVAAACPHAKNLIDRLKSL